MYAGGAGKGGSAAEREARNALFEQVKQVREELRPHMDERRRLSDLMSKIKEDIRKKTGETKEAKDKLPFRTIPEMEQRVVELEAKIESGQFKLIEEKQILAEISKLKKARRQLENIDGSGSDVGTMKLRLDKLRTDVAAKDDIIKEHKVKADAISKQIDELNGNKQEAQSQRQERNAAIEKLKKELGAHYEERRKAYEEYREAKKSQAEARVKRDARRVEYEKRREVEEKLEALEEKLLAFNPETANDRKISECNNLRAYFQEFAPAEKDGSVAVKKVEAGVRQVKLAAEYADAVPISKKDDGLEEFFGATKKKNQPKSASHHAVTDSSAALLPAKLPFHILSALADLQLPIPTTVADLPTLFAAIEKKKTSFTSKQDDAAAEKDKQRQALVDQIEELTQQLAQPIKVTLPPSNDAATTA